MTALATAHDVLARAGVSDPRTFAVLARLEGRDGPITVWRGDVASLLASVALALPPTLRARFLRTLPPDWIGRAADAAPAQRVRLSDDALAQCVEGLRACVAVAPGLRPDDLLMALAAAAPWPPPGPAARLRRQRVLAGDAAIEGLVRVWSAEVPG